MPIKHKHMKKSFQLLQEELREYYTTNAQGKPDFWAREAIQDYMHETLMQSDRDTKQYERDEFEKKLPQALAFLSRKVVSIITKWPVKFASPHEAFAVLNEEVEELWREVQKKESNQNYEAIMSEAADIAAVAIRILVQYDSDRPGLSYFFNKNA